MIIHVDMDAFYASVEMRDQPQLAGKPVVVAGSAEQRGVVSAASYEARAFGIHSAMPTVTAMRLCPHLVRLPVRMERYAEVSQQIHAIFARYTPLIEPLSLDEAFLDASDSERLYGDAPTIAARIKADIRAELALVASVGVAPNKFIAKIASDLDKPDGFVVVDAARVQDFLDPLPVSRLWGAGKRTVGTLDKLGIHTIGDLRARSRETLAAHFGKLGEHFWRLARGIDERPVVPDREAKSISNETTFAGDIADTAVLRGWLMLLTEQVAWRLRRHGRFARTVQLKVRFADFSTLTRARTLSAPTRSTAVLWETASELLAQRLPSPHPPLRLIGVGVSGLEDAPPQQDDLFADAVDESHAGTQALDAVLDDIKQRFGKGAVHRATVMRRKPGQPR